MYCKEWETRRHQSLAERDDWILWCRCLELEQWICLPHSLSLSILHFSVWFGLTQFSVAAVVFFVNSDSLKPSWDWDSDYFYHRHSVAEDTQHSAKLSCQAVRARWHIWVVSSQDADSRSTSWPSISAFSLLYYIINTFTTMTELDNTQSTTLHHLYTEALFQENGQLCNKLWKWTSWRPNKSQLKGVGERRKRICPLSDPPSIRSPADTLQTRPRISQTRLSTYTASLSF